MRTSRDGRALPGRSGATWCDAPPVGARTMARSGARVNAAPGARCSPRADVPLAPRGDPVRAHAEVQAVPHDADLAYRWVSTPNRRFGDRMPLETMKRGYEGILAVRRYLDFERGR